MEFEWDPRKDRINQSKHGVSFAEAQEAFFDANRLITQDLKHSSHIEQRHFCIGKTVSGILTVRFTIRKGRIRIIGAGYWREGKELYGKRDTLH